MIAVTHPGSLNHRKVSPMIKTLAAAAVLSLGLAGYAIFQDAPAAAPMAAPMHHHHHHHHHHHVTHHHMHHHAAKPMAPAEAPKS